MIRNRTLKSPRLTTATAFLAIASVAAFALGASGHPSSAGAASQLLPDLIALAPSQLRLSNESGGTYLRFTTTSWNNGAGALELFVKPDETPVNGKQKVYQRIFLSGGGSTETLAGEFIWHPTHNHFHFEGYAIYELSAPGLTPRIGQKTSFCVMDTTKVNTKLKAAPKRAQYTSCGNTFQGMSVGWGDSYGYSLDGQQIDVSGLPSGIYQLTIKIDPNNKLVEGGDNARNDITVNVNINFAAGTATIVP